MKAHIPISIINDRLQKAAHEMEMFNRAAEEYGMFDPEFQRATREVEMFNRTAEELGMFDPEFQRAQKDAARIAKEQALFFSTYQVELEYMRSPAFLIMQEYLDSPAFQTAQRYIRFLSSPNVKSCPDSFKSVDAPDKSLSNSHFQGLNPTDSVEQNEPSDLADNIFSAVASAEPYMSQAQTNIWFSHIQSIVNLVCKNKFSISDIFAVLTFIATIYFGIVHQMPDEQQERILQQNETIISQNEVLIRQQNSLTEEDRILNQTLNNLTYSIYLLTDKIESLREEHEIVNNALNDGTEPDAANSQQDDADTQNQNPDF